MLTVVKNTIKVSLLSIKYNIIREMTNKVTFITNIIFMMLNNATFIIQWLVLFNLKNSYGGYTMKNVMLLWAVSSASYGLTHIFCNGIFKMPQMIENGKIDSYLIIPKNTLLSIATSSTRISAIGDLLYGYLIFIIFDFSLKNLILFIILTALGSIIYTSIAIIYNSLTFYFIRSSYLSENIQHIFISSSLYPETIFTKAIKIILYTLIPVGLAVYMPVNILINFNLINLIIIIISSLLFLTLGFIIFYRGLKRYTSSNLMVART